MGSSLLFASKLMYFSPVAFGWPALRRWAKNHPGFPLLSGFNPKLTAGLGFAIECRRYRSRPAYLAHKQDVHFEIAAFGFDVQPVTNLHLSGWFGWLMIRLNAAEIAGASSQGASFKESRRP
jgi:hypothetical protein